MEIKQSRNSNRTRFEFGEDELNYIDGEDGTCIVQEIESRRADQFGREYDPLMPTSRRSSRSAGSLLIEVGNESFTI